MIKALPNRQSIRMRGWDYTAPGWYFVTINAKGGRSVFGAVVKGRMVLNEAGQVAEACWREISAHFPKAKIDEFVIMPNHMHGIIGFDGGGLDMSSPCASSPARPQFGTPIAGALGTVVGAYKAAVTRGLACQTRSPACQAGLMYQTRPAAGASAIWHRNYWDVIVRDVKALGNIRRYIRNNPENYDAVMNVGEARFWGDKALMEKPKLGFLASRGTDVLHYALSLKSNEAVISGFLSPMERAVLKACLERRTPVIWVKPWGAQNEPATVRRALEDGRLLLISPFDDRLEAPSTRRAVWCNQYVLAHCDRLIVGSLNPDGMLTLILSEANPDMEIKYL